MSTSEFTVAQVLSQAHQQGLERLDAQMLLLLALDRSAHDRAWLLSHDTDRVDASTLTRWHTLLQKRLNGEPMAYLLGEQEFFGLRLKVDPRVLVPRADTETLVQWALELLPGEDTHPVVLDLGTGSGAIALAIKHHRRAARVHATDASERALAVARYNAERLKLEVSFHHGHWMNAVPGQRFDVIVSNPPYIAEGDPHLPALAHEPGTALTSGADGLDDLRAIVRSAPAQLRPGGCLLLEHGFDQASAVRELLRSAGFTEVASRKDLAGIERCSGGRHPLGR